MARERKNSDSSTTSSASSSSSSSTASEHSKEESARKVKSATTASPRDRNHREEARRRSKSPVRESERRQSDNRKRSPRNRQTDTRESLKRRDERDRKSRRERSPIRERRRRSPHDEEPRHKLIKYEETREEIKPRRRVIEVDEEPGIGRTSERHATGGMRAFGNERENKISSRLGPRPQNRRSVYDRLGVPEDNPDLPQSGVRSMVAAPNATDGRLDLFNPTEVPRGRFFDHDDRVRPETNVRRSFETERKGRERNERRDRRSDRRSPLRGMVADRLDWDRRAAGRPRYRSTIDNFIWQHDMYTKMVEEEDADKQHDDEPRVKYEATA